MENQEHEWIYEYDSLTINNKKYFFRCVWSFNEKAQNEDKPAMKLIFNVFNDTDKEWVNWKDFKGSYLAEKLTDYVKNSLNGQRTCYWRNDLQRNFD